MGKRQGDCCCRCHGKMLDEAEVIRRLNMILAEYYAWLAHVVAMQKPAPPMSERSAGE